MRCSDGHYYVVKFQNNPQHERILVNEFLGTQLASLLGLPTSPIAVVDVSERMICLSPQLCMEARCGRTPAKPGRHFGSRYSFNPQKTAVHDFLPDPLLLGTENLSDFIGMLAFDKWTCNTDGRQVVFFKKIRKTKMTYLARMIDQGFCFGGGKWNFPDAPLRGIYCRDIVYANVTSLDSFSPWLKRIENITNDVIDALIQQVPREWYREIDEVRALGRMLYDRRNRVCDLIQQSKKSCRDPFYSWH
jgi:hypothetical protein